MIGEQAGLVAHVVGRGQLEVEAKLLLVARQDVVAGKSVNGELKNKHFLCFVCELHITKVRK